MKKKRQLINLQKQGKTPDFCKNCIYQEEYDWVDDDSINCLLLNHFSNCNSSCVYCWFGNHKAECKKHIPYDVLPILKDMKNKGLLKVTDRSFVTFGGGEPTILKDFDSVLTFLIDEGFKNIRINSSGIKYSSAIVNGLKKDVIDVVISVDSGTKEIYKKIKRVDCFDKVWKNIAKYAKSALNTAKVKAKYIIVPDINDTQKDVDDFLSYAVKSELKSVSFSVEKYWSTTETEKLVRSKKAEEVYSLLQYAEKRAKKLNFDVELYSEGLGFKNLMETKN